MPTHTLNTGGDKVAVAKLDKPSYQKWFKSKKTVQNMAVHKSRLQLYDVNLKVNVPRPPRGVDVKK